MILETFGASIFRQNAPAGEYVVGGLKKSRSDIRVIIIGAGAAGMLAGIKLREAGFTNFAIYEKADEVGGTWRENIYPGVGCDVPAHHYNYSFEHNPGWSSRLAGGAEIQSYFLGVAEKYDLRRHIIFGHAVASGKFENCKWHIVTDKGLSDSCDYLVSATGPLHIPRLPEIEGLDTFAGVKFHSARWPQNLSLDGKKVGILGNGSSGVQIVSALARQGVDLKVFMRTPQWVFPLANRHFGSAERRLVKMFPVIGRTAGAFFQWFFEHVFAEAVIRPGWQRRFLSWACRRNLASVKDAELRRELTPDFQPLCKRMVMSADFYPALQLPNVTLVRSGITKVTPDSVITDDGIVHRLDVLIMATGFWTRAYGRPLDLSVEETGKTLADEWAQDIRAHQSVHVPGIPNYMIVGGPLSPRGNFSAIAYSEAIVDHIVRFIALSVDEGICSSAALERAHARFKDDNSSRMSDTIWVTGCQSWYLNEKGEPENWTGTPDEFREMLQHIDLDDFDVQYARDREHA
jgi:cation diffusion facilitator CzcD-associated flavoprotein CzcO